MIREQRDSVFAVGVIDPIVRPIVYDPNPIECSVRYSFANGHCKRRKTSTPCTAWRHANFTEAFDNPNDYEPTWRDA